MFIETSLRRSPSTPPCSSITRLIFRTSSSEKSFTRTSPLTPASFRMVLDLTRPIPKIYVNPISMRLVRGRSTPAIRAMAIGPRRLTLPLLVFLVGTNHPHDPPTSDDLALVANALHRRSDLH